jgi:hypothetical protein
MKFYFVVKLAELLALVEKGEPIPPELLEKCKKAVEREISIMEKRQVQQQINLQGRW